jgi:glycosyltransferase involved in cell wall biosynthesis
VICNVPYHNRMKVPARLWSFGKFALLGTVASVRERGPEIVFATSTPLTVGIPGRISAALRRIPYVFEVRDLWPEDLLAAERLKPGPLYRVCQALEAFSYARAARILLVSRGFHDRLLERGLPPDRLKTIHLGGDGRLFEGAEPDSAWLQEHGLEGKTIAIYAGSFGDANGLSQVLDAAAHLRDRPEIALVMIGDGKMRGELEARAAREGLHNVRLLPPVPKERLPGVFCCCHVGLMILKQIVRPRWVTPNKLFDYMFSGLPTVVNFPGTTAELVQAEGIGSVSEPGSAEDLAAHIRRWADDPQERARVGEHARELAFAEYDRKTIARKLLDVFQQVVDEAG